MPLTVNIAFPDANDVHIDPWFLESGGGVVNVVGRGNRLRLERPFVAGWAHIEVANGASIVVGPQCSFWDTHIHAICEGASIDIGPECAFNGRGHVTAHEPAAVSIGAGCLVASDCSITSSDVHKIYDAETGTRVNPGGDIGIGERVWLAAHAVVRGGTTIGSGSIVGMKAIVRGHFEGSAVIAGAPARVIRRGIRWER